MAQKAGDNGQSRYGAELETLKTSEPEKSLDEFLLRLMTSWSDGIGPID